MRSLLFIRCFGVGFSGKLPTYPVYNQIRNIAKVVHTFPANSCQLTSIFSDLPISPEHPHLIVPDDAIDLNIETYRNENGKPWPLPVVRIIEKQLANDDTFDNENLDNASGYQLFIDLSTRLIFGPIYGRVKNNVVAVQTVSGTGALRLGFEFMLRALHCQNVMVSDPTYSDYKLISTSAGFSNFKTYPYYDFDGQKLKLPEMLRMLSEAEPNSVIVLQIGHNPTGVDPNIGQWREIAEVVRRRQLVPFFDVANVGLLSGSVDEDLAPLRVFVELGIEFFLAQSFSKNFGLYNERVGNLVVFTKDRSKAPEIKQYLREISRAIYTNPPVHGARVVSQILKTEYHRQQWTVEVSRMYQRIQKMRQKLRKKLEEKQTPGNWHHLTEGSGLFSVLCLRKSQLEYLKKVHNIYTGDNGRINVSVLSDENIDKIATAIDDAARQIGV